MDIGDFIFEGQIDGHNLLGKNLSLAKKYLGKPNYEENYQKNGKTNF